MNVEQLIQLVYLLSTGLFILSLKWMSDPQTARRGVSPVTAGAQHRATHRHHRAASASSSSRESESPGSWSDSDTASPVRSAFVMSPRRYASTAM